jgi:hypothetical protein
MGVGDAVPSSPHPTPIYSGRAQYISSLTALNLCVTLSIVPHIGATINYAADTVNSAFLILLDDAVHGVV